MPKTSCICCPPPAKNEGRSLKVKDADRELAALARALGHPARVRLLRLLCGSQGCYCGDLVKDLGLAQATVSQHLAALRKAGWIKGRRSGTSICYGLEPGVLHRLKFLLANLS